MPVAGSLMDRRWPQVARATALIALAGWASAASGACSVSPSGVHFGVYAPTDATALDGAGNISVTCTTLTSFTVSLSTGTGNYGQRRMTSGPGILNYNLYVDPVRLLVWGDGTAGSLTVPSIFVLGANLSIYGRVPAGQNPRAGTYIDTIVVTVTY
jgi:spore coat protein U-like protein